LSIKGTLCYANTIDFNFGLQQRPMHLMKLLAERGWKVYFINPKQPNDKEDKNIKVIGNLEIYNDWNFFAKKVKKVDVYFSSWAKRYVDLNNIKYKIVVYDSLDNFKDWQKFEPTMISKSDIVLTTSSPLYELRKKEHNNVSMCRNGCFSELGYKSYRVPNDLREIKNLKKPVLLFSGAVADWVDQNILAKLGSKYSVVIVGRPWGVKLPKKCYYLGCKEYDKLQAYYAHCDLGLLPFLKSNQTAYFSNPIKCYEYAAHGKQTIAYNIPEACLYPDVVIPSKDENEFLENIEMVLSRKDNEEIINKCKQMAKENDWNTRVDIIENNILKFAESKGIELCKE
jgi:hypothetical protein